MGIFVHQQRAWRYADAVFSACMPPIEDEATGKVRVALYAASHGRFAMVSMVNALPRSTYDPLILSLLDSQERTVASLNASQPHRIYGYSSSVAELADLALRGTLGIRPRTVLVGGDKLTQGMRSAIEQAWAPAIYDTYGASEAK